METSRGKLGVFSFQVRAGRCCLQPLIGGCEDGAKPLVDMHSEKKRKSQHRKLFPRPSYGTQISPSLKMLKTRPDAARTTQTILKVAIA